ncbi:MAG: hemolysin family protein [Candidatus Kapaibacterium sp.]|nr:hemolysin family protein [Bacteroidota bacterium]
MFADILLTLLLVLLNGFFVAAEFAIVKVRASQIELKARAGNIFAKVSRSLLINLDAYLSATQLGITLASLGLGYIGERVFHNVVLALIHTIGLELPENLLHQVSFVAAFSILTVLHIVLGELAPKSMAIQRSESVTLAIAFPLRAFYYVFRPFIWMLNILATIMLKIIGIEPAKEHELHSPEELRYLLEESQKGGAIEEDEHELIENVFEFKETIVSQVMVPRTNIVALEFSMPPDKILERVMDEGYSRMPVYKGTIDNIVGIIYTKDLLSLVSYSNIIILQDILRPVLFVQEDAKISSLLRRMKKEHFHVAIVVDEFGGTAGIVTMEDVIEEIVGEIQDEYDEEVQPVQEQGTQEQHEYIVKATTTIADLNEHLPYPLEESDDYETLGGLLNQLAGRVPSNGETFTIPRYQATILESNKRVIESVKLIPLSAETEEE